MSAELLLRLKLHLAHVQRSLALVELPLARDRPLLGLLQLPLEPLGALALDVQHALQLLDALLAPGEVLLPVLNRLHEPLDAVLEDIVSEELVIVFWQSFGHGPLPDLSAAAPPPSSLDRD